MEGQTEKYKDEWTESQIDGQKKQKAVEGQKNRKSGGIESILQHSASAVKPHPLTLLLALIGKCPIISGWTVLYVMFKDTALTLLKGRLIGNYILVLPKVFTSSYYIYKKLLYFFHLLFSSLLPAHWGLHSTPLHKAALEQFVLGKALYK